VISLESLLRVPHIDTGYGFDVSSDGQSVCFSWNKTGKWELYEIFLSPFARGARGKTAVSSADFQPATSGPGAKFAPKYSPDATRIAYAVDLDGAENYHLFILNRETQKATDLLPDIEFALQPNFDWSPDGTQIALLADRDGRFDAYIISAPGGSHGQMAKLSEASKENQRAEFKKVFSCAHPCWLAKWSPDGKWIAIEVEGQGLDRSIFLVNLSSGETRQIGSGINAKDPYWSPDGNWLAFCSDKPGEYSIGLYELKRGGFDILSIGDGNQESPRWTPDGFNLICTRQNGAVTDLMRHEFDRLPTYYKVAAGLHSHPVVTPDVNHVLFIFENTSHPPDLWKLNLVDGQFQQLTQSLPSELKNTDFINPEEVSYLGMDNTPVPALLYKPKKTPSPAVVVVHGGPNWHYSNFWNPFMAYCALRGWTVLAPNYRGSTGYGRDWMNAARFDYGGVDARDVAAGAQWMVKEGLADAEKITVTGASHGGYLTMACLTKYPELWAAGSAVVPFLNWFTSHENSREDLKHWDIENMGDPGENKSLWRDYSPFFFLDRVRAPVQIICGANDPRCPASESIAAREKLLEFGKQAELILYKDEGHRFLKIENVIDSEQKRVDFLARVLEPANRAAD
jgi:dipeptidyl aminopeptidase/acylaminoacyl peptidase